MDRRNFLDEFRGCGRAPRRAYVGQPQRHACEWACIGIGGRGAAHIGGFSKLPNVEIVAICDIDDSHIAKGLAQMAKRPTARSRRLIPTSASCWRTSPSTPSPSPRPTTGTRCMTVWACQAGKDVYVEKPCSHNMFEAQQIVAAARKYDRMVQQGSQIRSSAAVQEAVQKMRDGADRRHLHGARPVLQVARHHRPQAGGAGARRRGLRSVDRARRRKHAVHAEPLPLQLALVLGHRQRRPGQPGHPRDGYGALGPGREVSRRRSAPSAATSCSTTIRRRPTP